jgi:hypothetical protein
VIVVSKESAGPSALDRYDRFWPGPLTLLTGINVYRGHAFVLHFSVHTEEVTGSIPVSPTKPIGP